MFVVVEMASAKSSIWRAHLLSPMRRRGQGETHSCIVRLRVDCMVDRLYPHARRITDVCGAVMKEQKILERADLWKPCGSHCEHGHTRVAILGLKVATLAWKTVHCEILKF